MHFYFIKLNEKIISRNTLLKEFTDYNYIIEHNISPTDINTYSSMNTLSQLIHKLFKIQLILIYLLKKVKTGKIILLLLAREFIIIYLIIFEVYPLKGKLYPIKSCNAKSLAIFKFVTSFK